MPEKILPQARYEQPDVGFRPVLLALVLMLVALAGIVLFVRWLYPEIAQDDRRRVEIPRFADPVLQPNTAADMQAFYAAEMQRLNGTGWIDRTQGTVHIPITDAMRSLAEKGIPDWPTAPERQAR